MSIFLDAMGGDNAPDEIIKGAVNAVKNFGSDITLIGDTDVISSVFEKYALPKEKISIIDAKEIIGMDEEPVSAVRKKKESSMVKGALAVKGSYDSAFISAGSTGALLSAALLYTGRIKGVQRPALCTIIAAGRPVAVLDNGANADCKPEYFVQFAKMGSAYYTAVTGKENPKAGLLNIGSEDIKGNALYKEAHALLKDSDGIIFVGNIEANAVLNGNADIIICDGFTGNVFLKTLEGSFKFVLGMLKDIFYKNFFHKLAALVIKKDLNSKKSALDPKAYGGVPLLGINGIVIKAHGNSDAFAIENAVHRAEMLIHKDVLDKIIKTL